MVKIIDFSKKNMKLLFVLMFLILLLYLHFVGLLAKVEFWNIPIPLIIAITIWYLNERSKRTEQQYKLRESIYSKMLDSLEGFYEGGDIELRRLFLREYRKLWLVSSDSVIESVNNFFDTVHVLRQASDTEKENALGKMVTSLRRDLISNRRVIITKLKEKDLKHIKIN